MTQQSLNAEVTLPLRPFLGSSAWYGKATGSGALVYNRTHSYEDAGGAMVFDTENYSGSGPIEQRDDHYITLTVRNAQQCQFRLDVPISIWGVNIYRAYNDEVIVEGPLPYPYPTLSFTVDVINLTRRGDTVTVTTVESVAAPCRGIPHQEHGFWMSFFQDYHCNYNAEPNGGSASISVNLTGTIAGGSEPLPVTLDGLDLPQGAVIADGSPARIVATIRNPRPEPVNAQLRFRNSTTGQDLPGCPAEVVVPPTGSGAPLRVTCDWVETVGMAWADENPATVGTDHTIVVQLTAPADVSQSRQAVLAVRPRPVVLVPGIAGTYSAAVGTDDSGRKRDLAWLMQRGVPPELLAIDPLIHSYDGILQTLANTGYVRADGPGKNLYVANYDWRLMPGPTDRVYDGVVSGLSAPTISDEQYTYGVDYLGRVLREVAERWQADYGVPLDEVDVIAHSTGGLVTRTYIQSAAYGGVYDTASGAQLPRIAHFISVGVPHRGASKAWNPLHDNWGIDPSFKAVLSKIANRAFQKVDAGAGSVRIPGPDYDITLLDVRKPDGSPDPETFIRRYIPTINALLATYPFLDRGNGELVTANDGAYANHVLLDLNNGADAIAGRDPNGFLDLTRLTVIAGVHRGEGTPVTVRQRFGPADDVLAPFTDFFANDAEPGELFFEDVREAGGGDGTVPLLSAAGQFLGDSRATVLTFTEGVETRASAGHVKLTDNPDVQRAILTAIGAPVIPEKLVALGRNDVDNVTSIILDPVQGYVVDGQGRRLGWSEATGPLQEIPNSVWSSAGDGFGLIFGQVTGPLRLELRGMDGPYYAQVTRVADGRRGGVTLAGPSLTRSETVSALAPLAGEPSMPRVSATAPASGR